MSVNKAILIGHVGVDPEVRRLDGGNTVANFTLATSENYTSKAGEKVSNTEWHRVVVWGKLAEIVEKWVKKGTQLYVEGKIKTRAWEDKEGVKKYTTEVVLSGFDSVLQMLGNKSDSSTVASSATPQPQNTQSQPQDSDSDLPF